ncbi:MAG: hypothetical protein JW951_09315, partial [Lentisphaerae bacterium]|nr:hypothetical protein [Lentisphaerota bacterium]
QTAGAYGAGVHERDALLITLGTCQVAYRAPAPAPPAERRTAGGPYPGGTWYAMAADTCGGNLINWAKPVLGGCETDDRFFEAAAAAPPGCDGLRFRLDAEGVAGSWTGVSTAHTAGHFARSILETLTERMAALVALLAEERPATTYLAAGGGSRRALWTGMLEARLRHALTRTDADPLDGAARMAATALSALR